MAVVRKPSAGLIILKRCVAGGGDLRGSEKLMLACISISSKRACAEIGNTPAQQTQS